MKCLLLACVLGACAHPVDDRPETLEYVTEAILAPNCGAANCHSSWKHIEDDVFDNVSGALFSMQSHVLLGCETKDLDPCDDGRHTYLYTVLVAADREGDRMPLDQPLANKDIQFIADWISDGAEGYVSPVSGQ